MIQFKVPKLSIKVQVLERPWERNAEFEKAEIIKFAVEFKNEHKFNRWFSWLHYMYL